MRSFSNIEQKSALVYRVVDSGKCSALSRCGSFDALPRRRSSLGGFIRVSLDDAAQGCESFDQGAATKYLLNQHGI
ncbi:hypothetical protein AC244_05985 [Ensifer adhaerens]|uniref:Uncharacterized protein n=1 Tax=Ensifer adhaerens TaxID=106592 RepID=A0A0L8C253_ENSAD|nr:hypothetical protein AC244_05985 [Ensifer adhaerens]